MGCLVEHHEIEQPVIEGQALGNDFRRHQPDLHAAEQFEGETVDKLRHALLALALHHPLHLAVAFGGGDVFRICRNEQFPELFHRQFFLLLDVRLHRADDQIVVLDIGKHGFVFRLEIVDVAQNDVIVNVAVCLRHRNAGFVRNVVDRRDIEFFLRAQRVEQGADHREAVEGRQPVQQMRGRNEKFLYVCVLPLFKAQRHDLLDLAYDVPFQKRADEEIFAVVLPFHGDELRAEFERFGEFQPADVGLDPRQPRVGLQQIEILFQSAEIENVLKLVAHALEGGIGNGKEFFADLVFVTDGLQKVVAQKHVVGVFPVQFVHFRTETVLFIEFVCDLFEFADVGVDDGDRVLVRTLVEIGFLRGIQQIVKLRVKILLILCIAHEKRVFRHRAEAGINNVERGFFLRHHQYVVSFEHIIHDQAGDRLRFARPGRALHDEFVAPAEGKYGVFLRGVQGVYVIDLPFAEIVDLRFAVAAFIRIVIDVAGIFQKGIEEFVDLVLFDDRIEIALQSGRIHGEFTEHGVVHQMEFAAFIAGKSPFGIFRKSRRLGKDRLETDARAAVISAEFFDKIFPDLLDDGGREFLFGTGKFILREDQIVVVKDVPRAVRLYVNAFPVAFQRHGKQRQRRADVEILPRHFADEVRPRDVKIVLPAFADILHHFPFEGEQFFEFVLFRGGIVRIIDLAEQKTFSRRFARDIFQKGRHLPAVQIVGVFFVDLAHIQKAVFLVDVHQPAFQIFQRFAHVVRDLRVGGVFLMVAFDGRHKIRPVFFHKSSAEPRDALQIFAAFGRRGGDQFERVVGTDGGRSSPRSAFAFHRIAHFYQFVV